MERRDEKTRISSNKLALPITWVYERYIGLLTLSVCVYDCVSAWVALCENFLCAAMYLADNSQCERPVCIRLYASKSIFFISSREISMCVWHINVIIQTWNPYSHTRIHAHAHTHKDRDTRKCNTISKIICVMWYVRLDRQSSEIEKW